MIAVLCRYGHQSYWDVLRMPMEDAVALAREIAALIERENKSGRLPKED